MKKKTPPGTVSSNLPVSKQTAGGVAGAIVGSVLAGPVGAVAGAIAGTIMGNRAAEGKTLVSAGTKKTAETAVKAVRGKLPKFKTMAANQASAKSAAKKAVTSRSVTSKAKTKPRKQKAAHPIKHS